MLNPYSEEERLQVMLACSYAGAQLGFRHLPLRFIIDPPHEFFDAHLARQVALHIFAAQFDVPRRRIAAMTGIGRWTLRNAVIAIDSRLDDPVFEAAYRRMARRALNLFHREIRQAAA